MKFMKKLLSKGETARFQIVLIIIASIILGSFFYIRLGEEAVFFETKPSIESYGQEIDIPKVETGFSLKSFSLFDKLKNKFIFNGTIWFEYDPTLLDYEVIDKFSFHNGKFLKKIGHKSKAVNGNALARFDISVEFTIKLDQRFFPFDDHRITLILTNEFVSYKDLMYTIKSNDFTVNDSIYASGYKYLDKHVYYGFILPTETDVKWAVGHPVVLFSLDFAKAGLRKPTLIMLPLILMFFISLFALTRNPLQEKSLVLRLAIAALPAIIAYRFVIETISPKVNYSILTDLLFSFVLLVSFLSFGLVSYYATKGTTPINERVVRRSFILTAHFLLLIFIFYLFFIWAR